MGNEQSATTSRDAVVRGSVVCLDAIESAVRARQGVRTAIVDVEQDGAADGTWIVAYVVMDDEGGLSARALRSSLREALPSPAIPLRIVALEGMPATAASAIDRATLPTMYGEVYDFTREYVAPRTSEEQALGRIWCAVLGMDCVGIDDDFFELGDQSLHAIQIVARVADDLGLPLSLDQLFAGRTIRTLAKSVRPEKDATDAEYKRS